MNTCLPKLHLWDFFSWALRLLTGSDAFCVGLLVGFLWCHVFVFVWQPWVFFLVLFRESRAALHCLPLNFKLHEYLVIGEAVYFCRDKNYKRSLHELYLLILAIHCVALIFLLKIYFVSCHERCSHSGSVGLFFFFNSREPACDAGDRVGSLGWGAPRRREWQSTPVFFAQAESSGGLQSVGSQRIGHNWAINRHTHTAFYSYPQNPVQKQAKMISV